MKLYLQHRANKSLQIELKGDDPLLSRQYLWRKHWVLVGCVVK
jgi:hypothetical protein